MPHLDEERVLMRVRAGEVAHGATRTKGFTSWCWQWLMGVLPLDLVGSPVRKADLVVFGLGNPGSRHSYARHNAGVLAAARLAELCGASPFRRHRDALVASGRVGKRSVLIVLPRVWMKLNGRVVARVAALAGCPRDRILVLHDDVQLPAAVVRVVGDGDSRSHPGLASVAAALGGADFPRIRMGIGPRPDGRDLSHLVAPLRSVERDALVAVAETGAAAAFAAATRGLVQAQNEFNGKARVSCALPTTCCPDEPPVPATCLAPVLPPTASAVLGRLAAGAGALWFHGTKYLLFGLASAHRATLGRRTRLVVVIGSFGKTTTCRTVAAALGIRRDHPMQVGGVNSLQYLAVLAMRTRPWHAHEVLEVGISRPGAMLPYARALRPDVVVFTCVGSEHHNSFASIGEKRDEKARMLSGLRPGGVLVANGDCPHTEHVAAEFRGRVIRYGFNPSNDVRATDVRLDFPRGTSFVLHVRGTVRPVLVPLLGAAMVRTVLAGVAVAVAEDVDLDAAVERLSCVKHAPWRLEPVRTPGGAWLLRDEYKGNEETVAAALEVLGQVTTHRRTVVLGNLTEPSSNSKEFYAAVGERVARCAERLICVGAHARDYVRGARRAGMPPVALFNDDRDITAVLRHLTSDIGPGDLVLIKGSRPDRLERLSLALLGAEVRCTAWPCSLRSAGPCARCPQLERRASGPADAPRPGEAQPLKRA